MSRRTRKEERLLKEQNTVGMSRAERLEQEELTDRKKVAAAKAQRMAKLHEEKGAATFTPRRVARVGKPLKR